MVVHRSQAASSQEQSSGQWTLLRGTASRIALLLLLLVSLSLIPVIQSNNFSHVIPFTQAHIHETNKHFNLQGNVYIDDGNKYNKNAIRYKVTSPVWKRNKSSHGCRIIMPPRRVMKAKTANKPTTSTPMMMGMMMKEISFNSSHCFCHTVVNNYRLPSKLILLDLQDNFNHKRILNYSH